MTVRSSTQHVAGFETVLHTCGQPRSEAVVFVHGNPGSGADFARLLADVGQFAFAVAPDMPNFGRSERNASFPCTVQGYANQLAAVLAHLGIVRAHLVLHDFGGPWGLTWAADHPQAVASVSLFNIGVLPGYRWHTYARLWRTPIVGELFMAAMTRGLFRAALNRENPHPFPDAFIARMFDDADAAMKRAALALYRATPEAAFGEQLGARLVGLALPALVVWGEADRNLPAHYAARQAQYFAVEEVQVLAECGHWPFIDQPARCSELLCAFLRRHLSARAPTV